MMKYICLAKGHRQGAIRTEVRKPHFFSISSMYVLVRCECGQEWWE